MFHNCFVNIIYIVGMKKICSNTCTVAVIQLKKTTLYSIIDEFTNNMDEILTDHTILISFYDKIISNYKIECEKGLLFVEKLIMYNVFFKFKLKSNSSNKLINQKILLYQWIQPTHLNLPNSNFKELIIHFRKMQYSNIPSVKIYYLMSGFQTMYNIMGKDIEYDKILGITIYCLIKARVKDWWLHLQFTKLFRRSYYKDCCNNCNHGFNLNIICECLVSANWHGEEEYYITTFEAALDFIEKLEYYNLNIGLEEFERNIVSKAKDLNLNNPNASLSSFFRR